jgi:hypothetical protein
MLELHSTSHFTTGFSVGAGGTAIQISRGTDTPRRAHKLQLEKMFFIAGQAGTKQKRRKSQPDDQIISELSSRR